MITGLGGIFCVFRWLHLLSLVGLLFFIALATGLHSSLFLSLAVSLHNYRDGLHLLCDLFVVFMEDQSLPGMHGTFYSG